MMTQTSNWMTNTRSGPESVQPRSVKKRGAVAGFSRTPLLYLHAVRWRVFSFLIFVNPQR